MTTARGPASFAGASGEREAPWTGSPPTRSTLTWPPGIRKTLPVETTRHAFAYVFAGAGKFCNASGPLSVPTEGVGWADTTLPTEAENRSLVLFDRGDEVTVQAGVDG